MAEFAIFLHDRRMMLQLSLREVSERLARYGWPVTKASVGSWERRAVEPPMTEPGFRRAMSASLEMDVNSMLRALGYITSPESHSPKALLAAAIVERLRPDMQPLAIALLETLERHYGGEQ